MFHFRRFLCSFYCKLFGHPKSKIMDPIHGESFCEFCGEYLKEE